jgi:riboflavin synthase
MFTGIVQGTAKVATVDRKENLSTLDITFPHGKVDGIKIGASVAINGTCLTVTSISGETLSFDVMMETLRATNIGVLRPGSVVNFERSAKVGDEIGGHNVSGHVHCTASIAAVEQSENNRRLVFEVSNPAFMKYVLPKGYIAVDGCSLTIGEVWDNKFSVYLIPETIRVTVFGVKGGGDSVNIEIETQTQAIVDTTERVVAQYLERLKGQQSQQQLPVVA